jgi:hypothetical protein
MAKINRLQELATSETIMTYSTYSLTTELGQLTIHVANLIIPDGF